MDIQRWTNNFPVGFRVWIHRSKGSRERCTVHLEDAIPCSLDIELVMLNPWPISKTNCKLSNPNFRIVRPLNNGGDDDADADGDLRHQRPVSWCTRGGPRGNKQVPSGGHASGAGNLCAAAPLWRAPGMTASDQGARFRVHFFWTFQECKLQVWVKFCVGGLATRPPLVLDPMGLQDMILWFLEL